jgi:hypothetical protein
MSSTKSKLRLIGAFAALAALALAISCRGFFVNPTLSSLAIGPTTLSLTPSSSYQMTATGTFSDGSQSNVTSKCLWSSSDQSVATVGANSGYVTASKTATTVGTTQISATDGTVTASTAATVTVCPTVTNLTITANGNTIPVTVPAPGPDTVTFAATADVSGTSTPVTNLVTWNIEDTSILSIDSTGAGTTTNTGNTPLSTTVTATLCNTPSTNTLSITVDGSGQ